MKRQCGQRGWAGLGSGAGTACPCAPRASLGPWPSSLLRWPLRGCPLRGCAAAGLGLGSPRLQARAEVPGDSPSCRRGLCTRGDVLSLLSLPLRWERGTQTPLLLPCCLLWWLSQPLQQPCSLSPLPDGFPFPPGRRRRSQEAENR